MRQTCYYLSMPIVALLIFVAAFHLECRAQEQVAVQHYIDTASIHRIQEAGYRQKDPDSALVYFELALKKSIEVNYANGMARGYMGIGLSLLQKDNYLKSLYYFNEAFPWSVRSGDKETLTSNHINKGLAYFYQGDYVHAAECYHLALETSKKIQPPLPRMEIKIFGNLGMACHRMGQMPQAIAYMRMAVDRARTLGQPCLLAKTLNNMAGMYDSTRRDSAKAVYQEALAISEKNDCEEIMAFAYQNLGELALETGDPGAGATCLKQALAISRNKYNYVFIETSYSLGEAQYRLGMYREAEKTLTTALDMAKALQLRDDKVRPYEILVQVYKTTGRYREAMQCLETATLLKDSFTSVEKNLAFNQLELRYKTAEKDKLLAENGLLIEKQKIKLANKNMAIMVVGAGLIILAILIVFLYSKHRAKLRSLEQENKISVLKAAVQGADDERSRIAADLHDGIGGMLSAAMMRFMAIHHQNKEITNVPAYHEAMDLLDEMGDEIRKTAHDLMPGVLLKQDLAEAVRSFCDHMQEDDGLQIDLQCYGEMGGLSQDLKLSIYRIIQELLKNITQHAQASHALVQLLVQEQMLILTVEDNGIGFDTTNIKTGMGLYNLRTRVSSLDGAFNMESRPGEGTSVNIEFDLSNNLNSTP